jgi:hypothetical protein
MTGHEEHSRKHCRPSVRQLQIAVEQPQDADPAAIEYLDRHPGMRQLLEQARALDVAAHKFAKENPDFDWTQFIRLVDERLRENGENHSI